MKLFNFLTKIGSMLPPNPFNWRSEAPSRDSNSPKTENLKEFLIREKKYKLTKKDPSEKGWLRFEFDTPSGTSSQVATNNVKEFYQSIGYACSVDGGTITVKAGEVFKVSVVGYDLGFYAHCIISIQI